MPVVSDKTLSALGWPVLVDALVSEARTNVGREQTRAWPLLPDADAIRQHLQRIAEARRLGVDALEIPLSDVPDARAAVGRASREGVLEGIALRECSGLMRGASRVRRFLHTRREAAPLLAADAEALSDFEPLAAEIDRAIDPSGAITDNASPFLAELRQRIRGLHLHVKARIDEFLRDEAFDEVLREKYYTIRDDRYCVPVKASFRSKVPGHVHNASQSGQTLFIEPEALVDLGNQMTIATATALEEERRILRDLTDAVGRRSTELTADQLLLGRLDMLGAGARISNRLDATEPLLASADSPFSLPALRHPLLVLRGIHVVANDVTLKPGGRGLVVSGPNAGGKTVTVTAVGLCALMARAGLPVPAGAGARVPLYHAICTAIGDEGDLSKDLSTFTAHLSALRDIARETVPGTLVCIDEIAADTDPREGAAIAVAVLEDLIDRGAHVLLTTHLDEVKAKALGDERLESASVGFDFERLAPTFTLRMNTAGMSSAIEIARRVGLPARICDRAKELLGGAGSALENAIATLDRERDDVRRLNLALDAERAALQAAREEWERQRRELESRTKDVVASLRREVLRELEQSRDDARALVARLQAATTVREAVDVQQTIERAAAAIAARVAAETDAAKTLATDEADLDTPLRPGLRVRVATLGQEGEIVSVDGSQVTVQIGALRTRVAAGDVVPMKGRAKNAPKLRASADEQKARVQASAAGAVPTGSGRLDLRGLRADDAVRDLRSWLDRLARDGSTGGVIVHGHGTGALKQAVRDELTTSAYIGAFRHGDRTEGGDGVTIIRLRDR